MNAVEGWFVAGLVSLAALYVPSNSIRFTDITGSAGISFRHINGDSPEKHLAETIGSGGLFFDFDNDGWIDIFLVDGGSLADPAVARQARHRLFRNRGNGTFDDVTPSSGIRHLGKPSALPASPDGEAGCTGQKGGSSPPARSTLQPQLAMP